MSERDGSALLRVASVVAAWTLPLNLLAFLDLSVVYPNDFWWHERTGEIIARTGQVPDVELFSYAREGERWLNEPWLMQLALHGLFRAGGLALVIFAHAMIVAAGYAIVWWTARRESGARPAALAALLGACVGAANWGVRPQSASFLLFGALVALLEADRSGRRRALFFAAPLFVLWANCHGGFAFGLFALGTYALGRIGEDRSSLARYAGLVLASVAACLVTPLGPAGIVHHVTAFFETGAAGSENLEFSPLTIRAADGLVFFYAVGRFGYALVRTRTRPALSELLPLVAFGAVALAMRRASPWFGLLFVPVFARAIANEPDDARGRTPARPLIYALAAASLSACVLTLPWLRHRLPLPASRVVLASDDTPFDATRWVCANVPEGARLFSSQGLASYVEWGCPRVGVFVDTRVQAFSRSTWDEYLAVEGGRYDWERVLERHHVRFVMLAPGDRIATGALSASPRWKVVYQDTRATVFGPAH